MKGKHLGNRNIYTDQRDEELLKAYRAAKGRLMAEKGYIIQREAVDIARCSPCTRFFVSEQRASLVISQLLKFDKYIESLRTGNPIPRPADALENMFYMRRRMFSHLFIIYKRLRDEHPDYTHEELVTVACATPADEFYLTQSSATEILSRIHINSANNNGYTSNKRTLNR